MSCCNHECDQGRSCPNREPSDIVWPAYLLFGVIAAVFAGMCLALVDANWPVIVALLGGSA
jgi:hypothetical protein